MPTKSLLDISTDAGKRLLQDYLDWRTTGFSPWKHVGSVEHYKSRQIYQVVKKGAFRNNAQKIAKIAIQQLPAEDALENESDDEDDDDDEEEFVPEERSPPDEPMVEEETATEEEMDTNKSKPTTNPPSIRDPINIPYPTNDRIFLLFELDGDVSDVNANKFQVSGDGLTVWVL